jgi:hypothetical protein
MIKIADIIFDLILEEITDKKLLNLINVWYGAQPTDEQRVEGEFMLEKYVELKASKRLGPQLPQIKRFKRKFNDFKDENLTLPQKFSYHQMLFLIGEFFPNIPRANGNVEPEAIESKVPEVLRGHDLKPDKAGVLVNASKELWYGQNEYLIADEGDFRIYAIPDRKSSIYFGYYEQYVTESDFFRNQPDRHMQWCTTRWNRNDNLYVSYRNKSAPRTFYFVIDETKSPNVESNPKVAQYYLSALQTSSDTTSGFRLTSILNDGSDPEFSREKLLQIYPKLAEHLEKIVPVRYDEKSEIEDSSDIVDRISELEGSQYEFAGLSGSLQRQYVHRKKLITKPLSWEYMDEDLRKAYINLTDSDEVFERFGSKPLFDYIKSIKQDNTSLNNRLEVIGVGGISYLTKHFIETACHVAYFGKKDQGVKVYQDKKTHLYGIYNDKYPDWLMHDGISYVDKFKLTNTIDIPYETADGDMDMYVISEYVHIENQAHKFYTIETELTPSSNHVTAYVLSQKQFLSVIDKVKETKEVKPEYADLGEMKKGL